MDDSPPIGIDLGTTYTCAAIVVDGVPKIIRSNLGYATIPSVVTFDEQGKTLVGQRAESRMMLHPTNTIYGSKRLLGRAFVSAARETYQPQFRYKLVADQQGLIAANICDRTLPLVEVATLILAEMRDAAQTSLGTAVSRAVITVPAYYNEKQRGCVREAGAQAGLEVLRIINEPTAAALCYGRNRKQKETILVFDLGGGTFDVTVLELNNDTFTVRGVDGDPFLGGLDFDNRLLGWVEEQIATELGKNLDVDPISWERLRDAAQEAKHELSTETQALIDLPLFEIGDGTTIDLEKMVARADLEGCTRDLVDRVIEITNRALARVGIGPDEIDEVLLVGGQTRMPLLHEHLRKLFGKEPSKRVHPDEAVALGAALAADAQHRSRGLFLRDVMPVPLAIADPAGNLLRVVESNTRLPHEAFAKAIVPKRRKQIKLLLFQGEHEDFADNDYLGTLLIDGITPGTGVECHLRFVLDDEGILAVYARVAGQGAERKLTLTTLQTPDEVCAEMRKQQIVLTLTDRSEAKPPVKRLSLAQIAMENRKRSQKEVAPVVAEKKSWLKKLVGRVRKNDD